MAKRCTACGQTPSGLISRHDFCEHCSAPLEEVESTERVTLSCYRCGARFEAPVGSGHFCPACANAPAAEAPAQEARAAGEFQGAVLAPLLWGMAYPVALRLAYAFLDLRSGSREVLALRGLFAFVLGTGAMALVGLVSGQAFKKPGAVEQALSLAAAVGTAALLWQFS